MWGLFICPLFDAERKNTNSNNNKKLFICLFFGACNIRSGACYWVFVSALSGILRKFKFNVAKRP